MPHDWSSELDAHVDGCFEQMVELRRRLHAHPEPSGQEHATSLYLYQLFNDLEYDVRMGPEGRGLIVDRNRYGEPARVALRADLDALHIHDRKDVPYRSQRPGVMHACGHDAHSAIAFGAFVALREMVRENRLPWPAPVRAIFQPSEETATGAREMIEAGALEGVEAIFAIHVDPTRPLGHIGLRKDMLTANCESVEFIINGRGGHAARPHESLDPIAAAAQLISTLYLFVPRGTDSQDAVVVTIGQISGGDNPNVIPERVELKGTLRTLNEDVRQRTIDHIRQLAHGIEEVSATEIEVRFDVSVQGVRNAPELVELVHLAASSIVGEDGVDQIPRPSMGSEDFAEYLKHIPGVMFRLGSASGPATSAGLHTPTFDIDEEAMRIGAKILARTLVYWSKPGKS